MKVIRLKLYTALALVSAIVVLASCGVDKTSRNAAEPTAAAAAQGASAETPGGGAVQGGSAALSDGSTASGGQAAGNDQAMGQAGLAEASPQEPQTPQGAGEPASAANPAAPAGTASSSATQAATQSTAASGSRAKRQIGELAFAEGTVTLHRAGAVAERADIGTVVRAFDVIATGPKSRAEIDLGSGTAGGATVKLAENTAFYFDTKELDQAARTTALQLLSGAIAVKVDALANGSFKIATDLAVLGVRGTVFIVDTAPTGAMLVTCDSGAVSVTAGGATRTSKPGGVVEQPETGDLRLLAVEASELPKYRGGWRDEAYKSFAGKALTYASAYASALDSGKSAFDVAYGTLVAQDAVLASWRAAKAAGNTPRFTDWIPEKKAVSAALLDCLKALFKVERSYYRLVELRALHASGIGAGTLKDGRKTSAYYAGFDAAYGETALRMARVREALSLFEWAAAGSPLGELFGAKSGDLGTGSVFLQD